MQISLQTSEIRMRSKCLYVTNCGTSLHDSCLTVLTQIDVIAPKEEQMYHRTAYRILAYSDSDPRRGLGLKGRVVKCLVPHSSMEQYHASKTSFVKLTFLQKNNCGIMTSYTAVTCVTSTAQSRLGDSYIMPCLNRKRFYLVHNLTVK